FLPSLQKSNKKNLGRNMLSCAHASAHPAFLPGQRTEIFYSICLIERVEVRLAEILVLFI
ncbi:MAG TPA: hypothetical protein PLS80_15705, partial [Cyclobacteriaceae bacterium]|nr:hypothetical protein [Cyclobacteriaceae bacterium]HNH61481.1 hypothetical protein [Cyclobacteriaceae bacterium]